MTDRSHSTTKQTNQSQLRVQHELSHDFGTASKKPQTSTNKWHAYHMRKKPQTTLRFCLSVSICRINIQNYRKPISSTTDCTWPYCRATDLAMKSAAQEIVPTTERRHSHGHTHGQSWPRLRPQSQPVMATVTANHSYSHCQSWQQAIASQDDTVMVTC